MSDTLVACGLVYVAIGAIMAIPATEEPLWKQLAWPVIWLPVHGYHLYQEAVGGRLIKPGE